jgi:hypothetical protein
MNLVRIGHKEKKIYFSVENSQCKNCQFPNKKIRLVLLRLAVEQHGAKQGHHQPLPRGRAYSRDLQKVGRAQNHDLLSSVADPDKL